MDLLIVIVIVIIIIIIVIFISVSFYVMRGTYKARGIKRRA